MIADTHLRRNHRGVVGERVAEGSVTRSRGVSDVGAAIRNYSVSRRTGRRVDIAASEDLRTPNGQ